MREKTMKKGHLLLTLLAFVSLLWLGTIHANAATVKAKVDVKKFYGMHNVDESSTHFSMDAREQFAVMKEIRENGYMLLANVHSHPDTKAEPSEEDKRLAYDSGIIYLICSFMETEPVLKAYRIIDRKRVSKVSIQYE